MILTIALINVVFFYDWSSQEQNPLGFLNDTVKMFIITARIDIIVFEFHADTENLIKIHFFTLVCSIFCIFEWQRFKVQLSKPVGSELIRHASILFTLLMIIPFTMWIIWSATSHDSGLTSRLQGLTPPIRIRKTGRNTYYSCLWACRLPWLRSSHD